MSIELIAAIDTSCRPPKNTPKSYLHLHCSVKTPTESFTFQLPVPADAEIPVRTVEGSWGEGGGVVVSAQGMTVTCFTLPLHKLITLHIL